MQAGSTATIAQRLGALANRDYARTAAQEHKDTIEDLWYRGIRSHSEVAIALNRLAIPSRSGRPWSAGMAGRLLRRLGMDRTESYVRARRGDTIAKVAVWPEAIELEPQEASPRYRAVRI